MHSRNSCLECGSGVARCGKSQRPCSQLRDWHSAESWPDHALYEPEVGIAGAVLQLDRLQPRVKRVAEGDGALGGLLAVSLSLQSGHDLLGGAPRGAVDALDHSEVAAPPDHGFGSGNDPDSERAPAPACCASTVLERAI